MKIVFYGQKSLSFYSIVERTVLWQQQHCEGGCVEQTQSIYFDHTVN